jgi:hypothetical protein
MPKHHGVRAYRRLEVKLHTFFTAALYGWGLSALRSDHFTPASFYKVQFLLISF